MAQNVGGGGLHPHQPFAPGTGYNLLELLKTGDLEKWVEQYHLLPKGVSQPAEGAARQLKALQELRDNIEYAQAPEYYDKFLRLVIVGLFLSHLQASQVFFVECNEHKIRNTMCEIISRLTITEHLRPHARNIMRAIMNLLAVENEDNAVICLRIVSEFHRNYRQVLEMEVQGFLEFVANLYKNLPVVVNKIFSGPASTPEHAPADGVPGSEPQRRSTTLLAANNSFKTLTDCPVIVVLLFQLYPTYQQRYCTRFAPLVVDALQIQAPQSAYRMHRNSFTDFIACQVKTLSFVAFLVRGYANEIRSREKEIARGVMQLLSACPAEAASTRKELLVATRHILATDFRKAFIIHLDELLDEQKLIGTGRTCYETLRPLAYSTLADLVHHIRMELQLPQFVRVVQLYCRNLHDPSLPYSIKIMSAKLLLNLIESIARRNSEIKTQSAAFRDILMKILDTFVAKFTSLKTKIPKLLQESAAFDEKSADFKEDGPTPVDQVKECRTFLKTLLLGLKNLLWGVTNIGAAPGGGLSSKRHIDEISLFTRLLRDGLKCFSIYAIPDENEMELSAASSAVANDRKEALEHFANVFTMLDPQTFIDIFSLQMSYLYERVLENPAIAIVFQQFLQAQAISRYFMDTLLNFLLDKMQVLSGDKKESVTVLRLFKQVFSAITLFDDNEPILQANLTGIITQAMRWASEAKDPTNYYVLFRNLMRSLVSSKNDIFAKEFLPYLGTGLFDNLNKLQNSAHSQQLKDLFIELVITSPVRMTPLTTCIRHFMKPLLLAIEPSDLDLLAPKTAVGLRMLEHCVDKLSPDFLEPIMADIKPRIMKALWKHLRPPPYPYASQVVRIMGKLSGRNRNFFMHAPQLTTTKFIDSGFVVKLKLDAKVCVELSLQDAVHSARKMLLAAVIYPALHTTRQNQAYLFLKTAAGLLIDPSLSYEDYYHTPEDVDKNFVTRVVFNQPGGATRIKTRAQLEAEVATLRSALSGLLIAGTFETLKGVNAKEFTERICTHFGVLLTVQKQATTTKLLEISPSIFHDVILDVICSETRDHSTAATQALDQVYSVSETFAQGNAIEASSIPFFSELADRFAACCYKKDWFMKAGGVAGIAYLTSKLSQDFVIKHQLEFLRALAFVLKDLAPAIAYVTVEEAANTITAVLNTCHKGSGDAMDTGDNKVLDEALAYLASQLLTPSAAFRKSVTAALDLLHTLTQKDITTLLEPHRDQIFAPIFAQSFKKAHVRIQTGFMEALTYCLSLRPPLFPPFDDLKGILNEASDVANQDDTQQRVNKQVHNQRVAAIELMAASIVVPELQMQPNEELRNKIINIFFRLMASRQKPTVQAAKKGLEQVIAWPNGVPKDVLSSSLKNILTNLSDYRKLSEPVLEGILRLLAMLTKCFNVALGDKILEHLGKWLKPQELTKNRAWKPGEEIRIASLCVEVFHLLPNTAIKFVEPLVVMVMQLENCLPELAAPSKKPVAKELSSPVRDPLAKYLNRYPAEAVDFFLRKIQEREKCDEFSRMFLFMLRNENSPELRSELAKSSDKILSYLFPAEHPDKALLQFHGVGIIKTAIKFQSDWLAQRPAIFNQLMAIWNSPQRKQISQAEESNPLFKVKEIKFLVKCLLSICITDPTRVDMMFSLLQAFTTKSSIDFGFLEDYLSVTIPTTYTAQQKRAILSSFIPFFTKAEVSPEEKVQAVRIIMYPMLQHICEKNEDGVIDSELVVALVKTVISVTEIPSNSLQVELLRLVTLFVRYRSQDVMELRKDVIRFAWAHLKVEDPTTKQNSYTLVCYFVNHFETPQKIILQVYVALLRAYQPEVRTQVREALDVLISALPKRLPKEPDPLPSWIRWTRKLIIEEGHAVNQLVHLLQLIVRNPSHFYPWRSLFVGHMVSALSKLGLPPNTSLENRKLALGIVELLVNWERKKLDREKELQAQKDAITPHPFATEPPAEVAGNPTVSVQASQAPLHQQYKLPSSQIDIIITFLTRFVSAQEASRDATPVVNPLMGVGMKLLREAFGVWPTSQVQVQYLGKLIGGLAPGQEQPHQLVITGLNILDIVLEHQMDTFIPQHLPGLEPALFPVIQTDNIKIMEAFVPVLQRLVKAYPPTNSPLTNVYTKISETIQTVFGNDRQGEGALLLLKTVCEHHPSFIVPLASPALRFLLKVTKEHTTAPKPEEMAPQNQVPGMPKKPGKHDSSALLSIINLLGNEIQSLGDNKKIFFQSLSVLIEKSLDFEGLLLDLFKLLKGWMTTGNAMTPKDKATFILRLRRFEKIQHPKFVPLHQEFMDIVFKIYTEETTKVAEIPGLEGAFLTGVSSRISSIRQQFLGKFLQRLPTDLAGRLNTVLLPATWEALPHMFWIQPSLDVLLQLVAPEDALNLSEMSSRLPPLSPAGGDKSALRKFAQTGKDLLASHELFLQEVRGQKAQSLIRPLRELIYCDGELASRTWASLFSAVWDGHMDKAQREIVSTNVVTLLSQDWLQKQSRLYPNTPQALLLGVQECKPASRPILPVGLLKYAATTFNCWNLSIKMLEDQLNAPSKEGTQGIYPVLADLFKRLGEEDHYYAVLQQMALTEDSKAGLTLEQQGVWQRAQEVWYQALRHSQIGVIESVPSREKDLWEGHWIECAKHLNQWDILADYAKANQLPELTAEAAWKSSDWISLKEVFTKTAFKDESPRIKLFQAFMYLYEAKINEVDTLCKQVINIVLSQWTNLPRIPCVAYSNTLHCFQQIMELYESAKMLKELQTPQRLARLNDAKRTMLAVWRERLPNEFDDITLWHDIMQLRQQVFTIINHIVGTPPQGDNSTLPYVGYHEAAWTINKLARVARRQGLVEVCLTLLSRIYQLPNIDLQDAFSKLNEQIKCYNDLPSHYRTAIDIINSTNLKFFTQDSNAEFFHLKGEFLAKLGAHEEANTSLNTALEMSGNLAKGWTSWAKFHDLKLKMALSNGDTQNKVQYANYALACYMEAIKCSTQHSCRKYLARVMWLLNFDEKVDEAKIIELNSTASVATNDTSADVEMKDDPKPTDTDGSATNGTQDDLSASVSKKRDAPDDLTAPPPAKRVKLEETTPGAEPTPDGSTPPPAAAPAPAPAPVPAPTDAASSVVSLAKTFTEQAKLLPAWVWVQWIPVLLRGLQRPEAVVFKSILSRIGLFYPHALFYALHSFVRERKALAAAEAPAPAEPSADKPASRLLTLQATAQHAEEVLDYMSGKYGTLVSDLERMIGEIEGLTKASVLEETLSLLEELRTFYLRHLSRQATTQTVESELKSIHKFYFSDRSKAFSSADAQARQILDGLIARGVAHPQFILALTEAINRLRLLVDQTDLSVDVDRKSSVLAESGDTYYELPGQNFLDDREPLPEYHVSIEKFESPITVVRSVGGPKRMMTIRGHNGKSYHFLVDRPDTYPLTARLSGLDVEAPGLQTEWASEQRMAQTQRLMNRIFLRNIQTRKRNLVLQVPATTQLSPSLRIIPVEADSTTLESIFESWALGQPTQGLADMPLQLHVKLGNSGSTPLQTLEAIQRVVPDSVLTNFVYTKITESYDAIWAFKKYFAMQLAGSALIQYIFGLANKATASTMLISPESGQIFFHRLIGDINTDGTVVIPNKDLPPFRFTRNLRKLLGPLVHGSQFEATITAALSALSREHPLEVLRHHMQLYQRDDLVEWAQAFGNAPELAEPTAEKNTDVFISRLLAAKPDVGLNEPLSITPVNNRVLQLLDSSMNEAQCAQMNPAWAAWL